MTMDHAKKHLSGWRHQACTFTLCLVMFSHSYLLISVFPYSGFMAMEFIDGATEQNAGSYAGLIASSFMLARSMTAYPWGKFSDVYGRKMTVQVSLALSCLFSLLFGLTRNFWIALVWRFGMGLSNALAGTLKVAVSELAFGDEKLEEQNMNLVMSMWGGAFLLAPAIAGAVAEPVKQYPNWEWLQTDDDHSFLGRFFRKYPFFPPNLVAALLCVLSMLAIHFFVVETLPPKKLRHHAHIPRDAFHHASRAYRSLLSTVYEASESGELDDESTRVVSGPRVSYSSIPVDDADDRISVNRPRKSSLFDVAEDGEDSKLLETFSDFPDILGIVEEDIQDAIRASHLYSSRPTSAIINERARHSVAASVAKRTSVALHKRATVVGVEAVRDSIVRQQLRTSVDSLPPATLSYLWASQSIRRHILVNAIVTFTTVAISEAFPLFSLSASAGLGLNENTIGTILSVSGLVFMLMQLILYAPLVDCIGLQGSIRLACVVIPGFTVLLAFSVPLNRGSDLGSLSWAAFTFLVVDMAILQVCDLTFFTGMTVAINRLVPPAHRGTLNGLNNLCLSIGQGLGPVFAGLLVSFSFSVVGARFGAYFLFGAIAVITTGTGAMVFRFLREEDSVEIPHFHTIEHN